MQRLLRPVGIIVVAAAVGFALARTADSGSHHSSDALDKTASSPAFSLRYPKDWDHRDPPSLPGLTLSDAVTLGPSTAGERLGVGDVRQTSVGSLPARFLASLSRVPAAQIVALGPYRFDRYLDLRPTGVSGAVSVYLLATTKSTIVATCAAPEPRSSFTGECEQSLATLRLAGGAKPSGGVDTAYALGLNALLTRLNPIRKSAGPGLRAANVAVRAKSARRLATAEDAAADAAAKLSAGPAASINRMLVASLRSAANGYRHLATAALTADTTGYENAEQTLNAAQSSLTTAFERLAAIGYQLR